MNLVNLVNPPEACEQADFSHQFGQVEKQVALLPDGDVSTELEGILVANANKPNQQICIFAF